MYQMLASGLAILLDRYSVILYQRSNHVLRVTNMFVRSIDLVPCIGKAAHDAEVTMFD